MLNVAMPIAHEPTGDYTGYNIGGIPAFVVANHFDVGNCTGVCIGANPASIGPLSPTIWDLFAFCDGFVSLQGNDLILRLPRELVAAPVRAHNSGIQFLALDPHGAQLRHVRYRFDAAPGNAVELAIRALLADAAHPARTITLVARPDGAAPQALGPFLVAAPANLDAIVAEFMAGNTELFVRAGDVIGNFSGHIVDIAFLDSCGSQNPALGVTAPIDPQGRAINPSYYLFIVGLAANAAAVNLLTTFPMVAPNHPLEDLYSLATITAAGGNLDQVLDRSATHPPKPTHPTIDVQSGGVDIADRGFPIGPLGDFHQSRNATNPFATNAPVRWRCVGTQAGDAAANKGKTLTEVVAGFANRLPGPGAFDHTHPPAANHTSRIETYWTRYADVFNVVADAFDVPCELLLSIACKETAGGGWFNNAVFADSHEMDVIRMEPLNEDVNTITGNAATRVILNNYLALAGGTAAVAGAPHSNGANANIPRPWNDATAVSAGNAMTWGQLDQIADSFPSNVRISPGVMQTLLGTAQSDTTWLADVFGAAAIAGLTIQVGGIDITADAPPAGVGDLFQDWFGVSVNAAGANTVAAADVHVLNTQMKRVLHNMVAGCAHIKRSYNASISGRRARFNMITDWDFPTSASGYNDAAADVARAAAADANDEKWKRLYALKYFGPSYPQNGTKFFNAAVAHFNALPAGTTEPNLRLWQP